MTPRDFATDVVRRLRDAGYEALWAGGCVRDERLGLTPDDYDVATNARPEDVQKQFRRTIAIGAAFGVIDVIGPRYGDGFHNVQVATFRSDGTYTDGRRPDSVTFGTAEADAERRDFTINGLFFDPLENRLIDYVGGVADLDAKVLRAIGDPSARFAEDKLRILRAVRMATRFDLTIDPATLAAAKAMASEIRAVSAERIAEELRKLLAHPNRARGVTLLAEFGLLPTILPELTEPVNGSLIAALPRSTEFPLAFAALLLPLSSRGAADIGERLRLSNDEIRRITYLVEHREALVDAESLPASRLYPMLTHPFAVDLIALHRAAGHSTAADFCERTLRETAWDRLDPPPLLTGDDLKVAGYKPGPNFKVVLDAVRAKQLDGILVTPEQALSEAKRLLQP
jgi:poly(A) polymerase